MRSFMVYSLAGLLTLASTTTLASDDDEAHVYIGGNYGGFKARGGTFEDEQDFAEVTIGGFFNSYLGIEASALRFDEYDEPENEVEADGYALAVIGRLPLSDTWGIYAKAGQFFWDAEVTPPVRAGQRDDLQPPVRAGWKKSGDTPYLSAGMDIRLASRLDMVFEYSRYEIDSRKDAIAGVEETDLDTVKVGLRLGF